MLHLVKKIYGLLLAYLPKELEKKLILLSPEEGNQGRKRSNFQRLASFLGGSLCGRPLFTNTPFTQGFLLFLLALFVAGAGQVKLMPLSRSNQGK